MTQKHWKNGCVDFCAHAAKKLIDYRLQVRTNEGSQILTTQHNTHPQSNTCTAAPTIDIVADSVMDLVPASHFNG